MRKNCKKNKDQILVFAWDNGAKNENFYYEDLFLDQDNQFILQTSFGKSILSKKEAVRWLQERREKWDQYLN